MNCKVFAKNLVASSILVLLPFCAGAAFAHNFALIPDSFNPAPGSQSSLYGTFTHVVGAAQYSFGFAANMFNIKKLEVYRRNNGSTTPIGDEAGDFEEYHYEKKAPDAVSADCSRAAFDAPGSGTTVLFGKFTGEVDMSQYGGSGIVTSYSFTKTFLNLTNDGAAAERLGGDANAPEVVFAEDVPAGGVKEGSEVKFRFYVNGNPQSGKEVHASYASAPIHVDPAEGDMNDDWLAKVTDSDGYATFLLDHAGAWFVSMADEEAGYTGGILFDVAPLSEGEEAEVDLTGFLIAENANAASLGFPSYADGDFLDEARANWGIENASDLTTRPLGSTNFLTGQKGQLPGAGTGATFRIPLDRPREGVIGMTGVEQLLGLTAQILGEDTYNDMVAFLKEENENSPDKFMDFGGDYGKWYLPYTAKEFFDHFGLAVMGKFSDDHVSDIGGDFQLGLLYDEEQFEGGTVSIMYGSMIADSGSKNGAYGREITPEGYPVKVSLLYDGKSDNEINFSYWLAEKEESSGGGGGGCDIGLGALALAGLAAGVFILRGKSR